MMLNKLMVWSLNDLGFMAKKFYIFSSLKSFCSTRLAFK